MSDARALISAMAEKCKTVISEAKATESGLPETLRPRHLLWMCSQIQRHSRDWPDIRLHRWLGFVQGGILANRMRDLKGIREMFDAVKNASGAIGEDQDLIDHLDPTSSFDLDIGGQG